MKRHNISGQSFTGGGMNICLGLGSNIGNPEDNLLKALNLIKSPDMQSPLSGAVISGVSPVYLSSPVGNTNQPYFLNCAVLLGMSSATAPSVFAGRLLLALKDIEKNMGRKNESERYMPRIIDIDMLFIYDNSSKDFVTMDFPELKLPHPEIFNRRFVLYPVLDLPYGFKKPFDKESIKKALAKLENSDAGASQKISCYGKFDENMVQILR